jgi:hypothetical protein
VSKTIRQGKKKSVAEVKKYPITHNCTTDQIKRENEAKRKTTRPLNNIMSDSHLVQTQKEKSRYIRKMKNMYRWLLNVN